LENNKHDMNQIAEKRNETFNSFLISVDEELGRDEDSLHLFEWVIEDRYDAKITDNIEYYSQRPDLLHIHNEHVLYELDTMLEYFISIEEYEKCSRLTTIRSDFKRTITNI